MGRNPQQIPLAKMPEQDEEDFGTGLKGIMVSESVY